MTPSAGEFPLPSIVAGMWEKNPEGGESGVATVDDCFCFLIQVTNVW